MKNSCGLRVTSESDLSLTPTSMRQYEYKERPAPRMPAGNHAPTYHGLDIKDMLVSPYDQRANVNIWHVCLGAGVGLGVGVLLTHYDVNGAWADWIALPGDLFISALKCLVMPMVFCSVVVCIGELVEAGKAAAIGSKMITYFALASVVSSTLGTFFAFIMANLYPSTKLVATASTTVELSLRCVNGEFLALGANGSLQCAATNGTLPSSLFALNDTSGYFTTGDTEYKVLSVSEQIFSILSDLVPENIIESFAGTSTLSIIAFAVWFGVAVVKSVDKAAGVENYALLMVNHANTVILLLVNAVVAFIPFAIVSLIAGSVASYGSSTELVEGVAILIATVIVALSTLTIGLMGSALFVLARRNIFSHLRHMIPAQIFALGCTSSIATLPMTMRCVDATKDVSYQLSRFMLPLGATSNLNGTAVYMPLACVFLAKVGGYEDLLTPVRYVLLAVVSAISSFGVAGVPHAGLVMVLTVWRTVFGVNMPSVFPILVSTDWILDRLRTLVNITNDTIILRIIAAQCDETAVEQLNRGPRRPGDSEFSREGIFAI